MLGYTYVKLMCLVILKYSQLDCELIRLKIGLWVLNIMKLMCIDDLIDL